ncbi:hypothetical protein GBA63_20240 [Rubrobacter tropicus]|uniref:Uncharacterized protein n=1 Tax=Rubrobacter tropicus TaxID=2653851 RepID=A0A6G8QE11_9ACTN|nr:hypothetical protein [Rubrobacter tropicus]QIN84719.1 hypothetical protein GBA63_20240 [Rubrobacter tropicus]
MDAEKADRGAEKRPPEPETNRGEERRTKRGSTDRDSDSPGVPDCVMRDFEDDWEEEGAS